MQSIVTFFCPAKSPSLGGRTTLAPTVCEIIITSKITITRLRILTMTVNLTFGVLELFLLLPIIIIVKRRCFVILGFFRHSSETSRQFCTHFNWFCQKHSDSYLLWSIICREVYHIYHFWTIYKLISALQSHFFSCFFMPFFFCENEIQEFLIKFHMHPVFHKWNGFSDIFVFT